MSSTVETERPFLKGTMIQEGNFAIPWPLKSTGNCIYTYAYRTHIHNPPHPHTLKENNIY